MDDKLKKIFKCCKHHGYTQFVLEKRGYYRCMRCRSERVSARRRKVKRKLVETFGGECIICGYNKCVGALVFHHMDGTEKEFGIAKDGFTLSFENMLVEAKKCILVCANCHSEIHDGMISPNEELFNKQQDILRSRVA